MAHISGTTKCNDCNKEFEWFALVRERANSTLTVSTIPDKTAIAGIVEYDNENNPKRIEVRCLKCDAVNHFKYES